MALTQYFHWPWTGLLLLVTFAAISKTTATYNLTICKGKKDGQYADPTDCTIYYSCLGNIQTRHECPSGTYFNEKLYLCDMPANVKCRNSNSKSKCKKIVCYYPGWSKWQNGNAKLMPEDIPPHLCTHLIFAYIRLDKEVLVPMDYEDDLPGGYYEKLTDLKRHNPNLKVLLSVGGWDMGNKPFTEMVATWMTRQHFIKDSIKYLREYRFDGLDLHWQYPGERGSPLHDKYRFTSLVKELKAAYVEEGKKMGLKRLLVSAHVCATKLRIDRAYQVRELNRELDFINVALSNFHGPWESHVGHPSALYAGSWERGNSATLNADWAIKYWVRKGASKSKLIFGITLYGKTFSLSGSDNSVGAPAMGPGNPLPILRIKGIIVYYQSCILLKKGGVMRKYIESQKVPYLVDGNQWLPYEDEHSVRAKVEYVLREGYGGVVLWNLSYDDFNGAFCGKGKWPIMDTITEACSK